jgi:hypothetical protein
MKRKGRIRAVFQIWMEMALPDSHTEGDLALTGRPESLPDIRSSSGPSLGIRKATSGRG